MACMRHTHQSFVFVLGKCHCVFVEALEKQLSSLVCLCLSVVVLLSNVFVCALDVVWFVCVVSLVVFVVVSLFVAINRAAPVRNNINQRIMCALGGAFGLSFTCNFAGHRPNDSLRRKNTGWSVVCVCLVGWMDDCLVAGLFVVEALTLVATATATPRWLLGWLVV